jgi:hypothetical protein
MKAFLSLPLTVNFDDNHVFREDRRLFYSACLDAIWSAGYEVKSPVINEDWGHIQLSVEEFVKYDHDAIVESDLLIVVSSERLSRDIYLEIGLAVGREIPVIVFVLSGTRRTFMLQGLQHDDKIRVVEYSTEAEAPSLIRATLT